uniref:Uncharacterized protein n=1 Tax=Anguilla anguilla TaxID=7936 RepID=A0A0E9R1Q4_ANGAN
MKIFMSATTYSCCCVFIVHLHRMLIVVISCIQKHNNQFSYLFHSLFEPFPIK